jgi:hypothetical protein
LLLGVVGLLVGLSVHASAEMLCRGQNGAVLVRGECRKAETRLNVAALGLVGPAGPKGERGESGPRGPQGVPGEPGSPTTRTPDPSGADASQPRALWWPLGLWAGIVGMLGVAFVELSKRRGAAQRQAQGQLRPFVIFEPTADNDFYVRNIGKDTALNVKVGTFSLVPPALATFPWPVPYLRPDEACLLQGRTALVEGTAVADDRLFDVLRPTGEYVKAEEDTLRPTLRIEFQNVAGQHYCVQERLLYGAIEIVHFGPVAPPSHSTEQGVRQRLELLWQRLPPLGPQLQSAWQQLRLLSQKLQTGWRQWWRRRNRINTRTVEEEKEWGDGQ